MRSSLFFRLFPPPKFLNVPYAGLDISDDAIHFLEYSQTSKGLTISRYDVQELPPNMVAGGDIIDKEGLTTLLADFARKNKISRVKVSLPEEKSYMFQLDVPSYDIAETCQHIEFRLEENVPLSPKDVEFYFNFIRSKNGSPRVSVLVSPHSFIETRISVLHSVGLMPVAFEVVPKAVARAVAPKSEEIDIIVYAMKHATGLYIVSDGVILFSSTVSRNEGFIPQDLLKEVDRVHNYWTTRPDMSADVSRIVVVGYDAQNIADSLHNAPGMQLTVEVADVWKNAFDVNFYVPPISKSDSLGYAVAAGLALPLII